MAYEYPKPQRYLSREEQLSKLLELIKDGFTPRETIYIGAPDEPTFDFLRRRYMSFYKDESEAGYVGFPDSTLINELLVRGLISWRIKQHPNRSCKIRCYELTDEGQQDVLRNT